MADNKQLAFSVLDQLDRLLDSTNFYAERLGAMREWRRDKNFIDLARVKLASADTEQVRSVLDEMRNLRQGFGGYVEDFRALDDLIEKLYLGVTQLFMNLRLGGQQQSD